MSNTTRLLLLAAGLGTPATATAQTIVPIVEAGFVIPGMGTVTGVNGVAVDDAGRILVRARTNNPNPDIAEALLDETGTVQAYAGQILAQPAGAWIRDFNGGAFELSAGGRLATSLTLRGTAGGTSDDHGIYFGLPPQLQAQGSVVTTAPQVPAGTAFQLFLYPKVNDSDQVCFHTVLDDPTIAGLYDTPALFLIDSISGAQNVIAKRGDILPGQTWGIWDFNWNRHTLAFNNGGHVIYGLTTYDSSNSNKNLYYDYTKLAQMGQVSPFGSAYVSFSSVGLNNLDEHVFLCGLNDPWGEAGIVNNGAAFVQVGDSFPSIEPFQINYIGTPLFLGDDGRRAWCGTWNSPAGPQGTGIFVDYTLLVSVGETAIHGSLVQSLTLLDGSFVMSRSGRYLVFQATLADGSSGAYLIDIWL